MRVLALHNVLLREIDATEGRYRVPVEDIPRLDPNGVHLFKPLSDRDGSTLGTLYASMLYREEPEIMFFEVPNEYMSRLSPLDSPDSTQEVVFL